jgi:flagellar biosynthesis chaperone FliJ
MRVHWFHKWFFPMNSFRYPLQKVLDWRRSELELAELKFQQLTAAVAAADKALAELETAGIRAEILVRDWSPLCGRDLGALGSFRLHVRKKNAELSAQRAECAGRLAAGRGAMLEARRRLRLLEQLKERRLEDWRLARDKELEELASESYLARWAGRLHGAGG